MKNIKPIFLKIVLVVNFLAFTTLGVSGQIGTPEIQGPDKISWDSSVTFALVIKNGDRITKSGLSVDWVGSMQVSLPGASARGQKQIVKTPVKPGDFKETTFSLTATTTLQTPTGNKKVTVTKTITISDVEKECEEIDAEIKRRQTGMEKLGREINELKIDIFALKIPKLTSPEELKSLEYDVSKKKNELNPLLEALEVITEERALLRKTERQMQAVRHRLHQKMYPLTVLTYASARFKKSKNTQRDKIDFVLAVLGKDSVRKNVRDGELNALVDAAKDNVRVKLAPITAKSIFEFAKLVKLLVSVTSGVSLRSLAKIDFQRSLSSAVKNELEIESIIKKSGYDKNQQVDLERLAQILPDQLKDLSKAIQEDLKTLDGNENNRKAERASSNLNIKIALAHDKIIDTINSLPPESIYQKAIVNANRPAGKLRREIASLEADILKRKRANDRVRERNQEAISKREYIQVGKLNPAVRELKRLEKELADTKERQSEHCSEKKEAPKSRDNGKINYDSHILGEWVIDLDGNFDATKPLVTRGMSLKFVRENGSISGYIVKPNQNALDRGYKAGQLIVRNAHFNYGFDSTGIARFTFTGDVLSSGWRNGYTFAVEIYEDGRLRLGNANLNTFRFKRRDQSEDDADKIIGRWCRGDGGCVRIIKTGKGKYKGVIDVIDNERHWAVGEKVYQDIEFLRDGEYRGSSKVRFANTGDKGWKPTTLGLIESPASLFTKSNGKVRVYLKMN
jgi:hypothetical protein